MLKFGKYFIFIIMSYLVKKNRKCRIEKKAYLFVNTGQIGDLVVSSVILENDNLFKNFKCYFLIDEKYIDLFADYNGSIKIITYNKNKYKYSIIYRLTLLNKLKELNIEASYNITASRGFVNDELTLLSSAKEYYTSCNNHKYLGEFAGNKFDKKYNEILFTNIYNEYEKNIQLICKITEVPSKRVILKNNKTFFIHNDNFIKGGYITVSPFSSNAFRDWGDENYRNITEKISEYVSVIFLCSKNQEKRIKKLTRDIKNIKIIIGPLKNVPELIYNSKLFMGNDSGLTHIAYRLGIPVITILGGGCFGKFFPYERLNKSSYEFYYKLDCFGCDWECIYKEPYCITKIQKDVVLDKILSILKLN